MKKINILYILLLFYTGFTSCSNELNITQSGKSSYVIVTALQPTAIESKAAKELQTYVEKISGVKLPIITDKTEPIETEFSIGNTNRLLSLSFDIHKLADDGFYIKNHNRRVYLIGGQSYGTLYGVNELLEKYMGCRKYTPTAEVVPQQKNLKLPAQIDDMQVPVITSRNMLYVCANDPDFFDWLRLSQSPGSGADRGRWGFWVHSFETLLPPSRYFDKHPEYYTQNEEGKRVPSQLCMSNPEVLDILCKELEVWMAKKPEAIYWSVSQNDNYNYCKCDACRKVYAEEGSPAGMVIRFVNKVAERYPEKVISTLAYQFTRKAPAITRPAKNVNIMFCDIECNRSRAIPDDSLSASFRKDMDEWAKISQNILLWDYMVQFSNLYTPFPNLRTLQPNMKYFAQSNVVSMFSQGNPEPAGEMCYLRAYIAAKLLWNPDCDLNTIIDDFMTGYYGAAGPYLKQYIDLLHDNLEKSGETLSIFGNALSPRNGYLSPENLDRYNECFDQAEKAVNDNPELLNRVKFARLPIIFTELEQANLSPIGDRGFFTRDENGQLKISDEYTQKLARFIQVCKDNNTRRLCEWMTTTDEYLEEMSDTPEQYLLMLENNKASGKKVSISLPPKDNKANDPQWLTDGILGARNYDENWLGFKRDNFDVTVDLGQEEVISEVNMRFIQSILDRLFLPSSISVATSLNGEIYQQQAIVKHEMEKERNYKTKVFEAHFSPAKARYVKISVNVVPFCPMWHRDAKREAYTMSDEISVR